MFHSKDYYRKLDDILNQIEDVRDAHRHIAGMVDRIVETFNEDLGITSGRLYIRELSEYVLDHCIGRDASSLRGLRIPVDYPPVKAASESRLVVMDDAFPGRDAAIESRLRISHYAAFTLDRGTYLVSFGLNSELDRDDQVFALSAIRHALSLRLREASMAEELDKAEAIQLSLLPQKSPEFKGYDIAARTEAAEAAEVGGDIHDFLELGEGILGVAVGDASGHGLPAALQARDVITGLRMGVERELKITAVIRRLNRVIHASNLSTRFVSLFYGELETCGNLVFVNAGHCEPVLLLPDGSLDRLSSGGVILGPTPDAHYNRGYVFLEPGARLLLFSDGLTERLMGDEEFGEERLIELFRSTKGLDSQAVIERIFMELRQFGGTAPWQDDVTAVVIQRSIDGPGSR